MSANSLNKRNQAAALAAAKPVAAKLMGVRRREDAVVRKTISMRASEEERLKSFLEWWNSDPTKSRTDGSKVVQDALRAHYKECGFEG